MSEHIYKTIELTGSSRQNFEQAIERAISRANETIRNIRWFQVIEMRGQVDGGKVAQWQVTLKVGFTLEGATPA
jgi:flavin-binding protein dodecin